MLFVLTSSMCSNCRGENLLKINWISPKRVAFWTSEQPSIVRSLFDTLIRRAEALRLRAGALEAVTLIEMTAFATAVVMLYRTTHVIGRARGAHAKSA